MLWSERLTRTLSAWSESDVELDERIDNALAKISI